MTIGGNCSLSGNGRVIAGALTAPVKAVVTSPTASSEHQNVNIALTWTNGGGATSFNVYLDKSATHNPPTTKVVDNQNVLTYSATNLDANTEYVMRVDSINGTGTTPGDVVTFTTLNPTIVTTILRYGSTANETPITPTLLTDGTTGAGTWTIDPDPSSEITISTDQAFTAVGLKLSDGSGYSATAETRSLRVANNEDLQRVICTLGQHPLASLGFAVYLGPGFGSVAESMDFCLMISGTGISPEPGETNEYSAANWKDDERRFKAHTQAGKATGVVVPSNGRWYWVTMLWDAANLLTTLKVYDTTTKPWTLVGTTTLALRSFNFNYAVFGHCDAVSGVLGSPHYVGVIAIDTTGAAWPLLPDEALGA